MDLAEKVRESPIENYLEIARETRKQLARIPVSIDKLIREDREHEH